MINIEKKEIRKRILNKLRKQKEETRHKKSLKIKRKLFTLDKFRKAKVILFYCSFNGEVETDEMIRDAKKKGKTVALPVCQSKNRRLFPCVFDSFDNLTAGAYGIRQPKIKKMIAKDKIDFVVVPGVAFDRKGNRLGRGLGYYDRFLKNLSPATTRIGLAFNFQVLKYFPKMYPHDQPVHKVISN